MALRKPQARASDRPELDADELRRRQRALYLRLEDGYARIEQALSEGQDVRSWEDLWLELLDEYERISDRLRDAA